MINMSQAETKALCMELFKGDGEISPFSLEC